MLGLSKIFEYVDKMEVKSIVDTPFKFGMVIIVIAGFLSAFGHPPKWALIIMFGLGGTTWLIAIIAYIYFVVRNPDYLRSEKHQQTMKAIQILGDKENADNKNVSLLQSVLPPHMSQLLGGGPMKSIDGK